MVRHEDCCERLQMSTVCCLLTVMCTESEHITMTWINLTIQCTFTALSSACYAIRVITPFMSETTLRMIYYSYVHSIMTYGIIFWGNLPLNNVIFKAQKRIIRTMTNSSNSASCRQLFKRLGILPLQSQYIFSVVWFVVKNKE